MCVWGGGGVLGGCGECQCSNVGTLSPGRAAFHLIGTLVASLPPLLKHVPVDERARLKMQAFC